MREPRKPVSFKLARPIYDLLDRVARARDVPITAIINTALAEAVPGLRRWLAEFAEKSLPQKQQEE